MPAMTIMDAVLYDGLVVVTGWKLCGWTGGLCFAGRWLVQVWHRRGSPTSVVPSSFWWISLVGSALTLAYFVFGQRDSVGILQSALPMALAGYNLWLDVNGRRRASPA
jgi:lipid-A-disaccharide synthase-like uncharacterized protein